MRAVVAGDTSRGSAQRFKRRNATNHNAFDPALFARGKDLLEGV